MSQQVLDKSFQVQALVEQITRHRSLYYSGKSEIPDLVYDALENELRQIDPGNSVFNDVGTANELVGRQGKIQHLPPMLSLEKSYNFEDLSKFVDQARVVCSEKFDGMALSIEYSTSGALSVASTRGNGAFGENVTSQVKYINAIPKNLADLLKEHVGEKNIRLEIRGEVFFPINEFEKFSDRFDSYRNAVPGTFGRKDVDNASDILSVLGFCAYDFIVKSPEGDWLLLEDRKAALGSWVQSFWSKLQFLEKLGFYTGIEDNNTFLIDNSFELQAKVASVFAREKNHLIDGLVFRLDDELRWENLGHTAHHPRGSLAFKQAGETAQTKILDIETNVGRSGKITFRARLNPVELSGAKISFATLHNADFIEKGLYSPGSLVEIKRSGEVIPSIVRCVEISDIPYSLPASCPCGYALSRVGPDLLCLEKRPCAPKDQESLVHFLAAIDLLGISDKTVVKLVEAGIVKVPADFFRLKTEDLLQIEGFAKKSAEKFVRSFSEKSELSLAAFLTSLGLRRGGKVKCLEVARHFITLEKIRGLAAEDLLQLKGWAEKSSQDFVNSLAERSEWIDGLLDFVKVTPDEFYKKSKTPAGKLNATESSSVESTLAGKNVCITGSLSRPREEYEKMLLNIGAKLASGITSRTHFLVCNEPSGSSKFKKAQELSVPVLTEEEFLLMLNQT